MARIIVIGAGITGVTTAYALLERGHDVTVVEKARYAGMETSYANGGQLSASNAEVWNSWATILKGMKWMLRKDAPLLLNPAPSAHKYGWLASFTRGVTRHDANTVETARMAIAAREHLFRVADKEGIDFDLEKRGILHVYHDAVSLQAAESGNALLKQAGLERYAVSPAEMRAIEPALVGDYAGGLYTPSDATGDIHKFTVGLAQACTRRGATMRMDTAVTAIEPHGPGATVHVAGSDGTIDAIVGDAVVVCAGVASRQVARMLGDRVNIYPVKGYSITVHLDDDVSRTAAPTVSLLDEESKIVSSRLGRDRLRIAGTAEFNGYNKDIRADRVAPLARWCQRHFPAVSTRQMEAWTGLRPMTPSMMPRVGRGRQPFAFYNTGHGHLGWTLAAITAEMVADEVSLALEQAPATRDTA